MMNARTNSEKIILVLIIFLTYTAFAQTDQLIPVFTEVSVAYQGIWSPNSESFVYKDLREDIWHQLDIDTLAVDASADFPFAIELSAEEEAFFEPRGLVLGLPDHELVLFARLIPQSERSPDYLQAYEVIIGNRATREMFRTHIRTEPLTIDYMSLGKIFWSTNGYQIVMENYTSGGYPFVMHINICDSNDLSMTQVIEYPEGITSQHPSLLQSVDYALADMSADGNKVLLRVSDQESDVLYLVEWHPVEGSIHILLPIGGDDVNGRITSQFYSPIDSQSIIYWKFPPTSNNLLEGALYIYNVDTEQESLLWSPNEPVFTPIASPDGRWMIIEDRLGVNYLLNVMSLLERLPITD